MTEEKTIVYSDKIKEQLLQKRMLEDSDVTDKRTNKAVSIKVVDEKNNIHMLIEALSLDISSEDSIRFEKGCFIKRFEFDKHLIGTYIWFETLAAFLRGVMYSMIPSGEKDFKCRYRYIWAQKKEDEQCVIAEIFGLKPIQIGDIITYKKNIYQIENE